NFSGIIGSVSRRQKPYFFLSMSSGMSSSATCPTADEMTYCSFSKWSPCFGIFPRTRAMSAATLGFSAMTRDLDIEGREVRPHLAALQVLGASSAQLRRDDHANVVAEIFQAI